MNRFLSLLVLAAGLTIHLQAAIDGLVLNKTTGKAQAGVAISLVKPGQGGMRSLGTTTSDAAGRFAFANDEPGGGPQLLQANYGTVNYNKLLTPNVPTTGVELDVYEATKSAAVARVTQRMLVVEPAASQTSVNETIVLQNDSNTTFNNPTEGGIQFYLPPAADGQVRVQAQGPQGMPLPRPAERVGKGETYKVDFPVKPGQTEFQVQYVIPTGSPLKLRGEAVNIKGMGEGPMRLVAPSGVTIAGDDVQSLGVEPTTQATIYNVLRAGPFSADVTGMGSLRGNGDSANSGEDNDSPQATEGIPTIYNHMGWLLGLSFAILGLGLVVLFRASPVRAPYGPR